MATAPAADARCLSVGARLRRLPSRLGRVHLMTIGLCLAAALLTLAIAPLPGARRPYTIPWYVIAPMFCAAEVCVVHIQFRREAHSFSLSEVPLVLGLFFGQPLMVVIANIIGTAVALVVYRRQSLVKLAFNLGNFTLGAVLAVALFGLWVPAGDAMGNAGCLAALGAVSAMGLLQTVMIIVAIFLSDGRVDRSGMFSTFGFAMLGTVVNICLGLIAAGLLWLRPEVAWLLVVPIVGVVLAYRSYVAEREKRDQVGFLYESSRQLQRTTEVDEALVDVLRGACATFRAEMAEITIFAGPESEMAMRTSVGTNGRAERMRPVHLDEAELGFITGIIDGNPAILDDRSTEHESQQFLARRGLGDGMVAVMRGETRPIGIMLIGNRLGEVSHFDEQDLQLFEMLAAHTGATLEKGQLEHSLAQLTELQQQLRHQALHDPLTGMANRLLFRTRVGETLERTGQVVAVLFIDLDDFKTINDSLGHAVGDELLCAVAGRLAECVRPADTAARLGGDEFAVLLEDVGDGTAAITVAERIVTGFRAPFAVQQEELQVHASVGVVTDVAGERTAEELLRNADEAMYTAKSLGKGRWEMFAPSMHAAVRDRHELKADLHRALEREELIVNYQPIMEVQSGQIVASEALLRWRHPRRGLIQPGDFISLAEETGLIVPIGQWVLERACREAVSWQTAAGPQGVAVSVNLSARQLQRSGFVGDVRALLDGTGLDSGLLILEVTESLAVDETHDITGSLQQLRAIGTRIALDDFGTGHSSLSRLRDFPIDIIKIDKSFTAALGQADEATGLSQAIFRFGQSLGLTVVAEGVEDPSQLDHLRGFSCEWAQGFHLAPPLSPEAMLARIRSGPIDIAHLPPGHQLLLLPIRSRAS